MGYFWTRKKGKERKNKIKMKELKGLNVFWIETGKFLNMNIPYFRPSNKSAAILPRIINAIMFRILFISFYESWIS